MDNKKVEIETKSPTVPMKVLRKLYFKLEKYDDDTQITFELILTALFPTIWSNIQRQMSDYYMQGYLQGKEDQANEDKRNN